MNASKLDAEFYFSINFSQERAIPGEMRAILKETFSWPSCILTKYFFFWHCDCLNYAKCISMKRIFNLLFVSAILSIIAVSCSNTKTAVATRNDLVGNWRVSHVEVEGADASNLNVTSFDDVPLKCFEGSQWSLPNSGNGNYNISQSGCRPGDRRIVWSQEVANGTTYLGFKHMDDLKNNQAKTVKEGYRLQVTSYEKNHFIAKSPVSFEGKTIYIVYHFEK